MYKIILSYFFLLFQVADMIREKVNTYKEIMPALLEIPSKEHPYDPDKDAVLQRVNRLSATD